MSEHRSLRKESSRDGTRVCERWWIVITRGGNVYPLTNPDEAARWEGKAAEIVGPLVPAPGSPGGAVSVTDEMIERGAAAARVLFDEHVHVNERPDGWRFDSMASAVLRAALEVTDDQ